MAPAVENSDAATASTAAARPAIVAGRHVDLEGTPSRSVQAAWSVPGTCRLMPASGEPLSRTMPRIDRSKSGTGAVLRKGRRVRVVEHRVRARDAHERVVGHVGRGTALALQPGAAHRHRERVLPDAAASAVVVKSCVDVTIGCATPLTRASDSTTPGHREPAGHGRRRRRQRRRRVAGRRKIARGHAL